VTEERFAVSDEWLGAYADGELDAADRDLTEDLLAADPALRRRLAAIREVSLVFRAATRAATLSAAGRQSADAEAPTAEAEPLSPPLGTVAGNGRKRFRRAGSRRGWLNWRIAASFAAGALVLFGTLELGGRIGTAPVDWHDSALAFHDMYVRARANQPQDTMLDILENQPDELARLISFEPTVPDLARHGYRPAGAHLITGPDGPVLYVVFEGERRPPIGFAMTRPSGGNRDTGSRRPAVHGKRKDVTLVSWSSDGFEYGLGGQLSDGDLMRLADTAQRSLPPAQR
jgi:anti-sigma factor RsiW